MCILNDHIKKMRLLRLSLMKTLYLLKNIKPSHDSVSIGHLSNHDSYLFELRVVQRDLLIGFV